MMSILALVLRWTPRVMPRERLVSRRVTRLMHARVHRRARGTGRVVQGGVDRALRADALAVSAI